MLPHAAPASLDPPLLTFVAELAGRGFVVELVTHSCCGEEDQRLYVWDAVSPITVEVLIPNSCWPGRHWDAVRVDGEDRVLWRGPCHDCEADRLVAFIGDLLVEQPADSLGSRYRLLG